MITLALAIPTLAREDRAREESLARTCADIGLKMHDGGIDNINLLTPIKAARLFTERQANWALGQSIFRWLSEQTTSHVGVVQDDVRLHPRGWKAIEAMLEVKPRAILGLHASHPALRQLFVEGGIAWGSTDDGLVGTMWIMPRGTRDEDHSCERGGRAHNGSEECAACHEGNAPSMIDLVRFATTELARGALERLHEDDLIGLYAMARGIPILHPVVSPMDHDVSVASAYGNDNHAYRRPAVTLWDVEDERREALDRDWTSPETYRSEVASLGRFYKSLFEYLPILLADAEHGAKLRARYATRVCPPRLSRYFEPL